MASQWPPPPSPHRLLFGEEGGPAGQADPTFSLPCPLVSFPLLFSQFQSFTCNRLPETTAFPVLCLMPPWEAGEQGELGEWWPCGSSPFALHHAALCRLALPNFCLKLNLKEKKPKQRKQDLFFYWAFHLPEVREGAGQGGENLTGPLLWSWGKTGRRFRCKTSCSFLFQEKQPRTLPREALPMAPGRSPRHLPVGQSRGLQAELRAFLSSPYLQRPLGLACLGGAREVTGLHGIIRIPALRTIHSWARPHC